MLKITNFSKTYNGSKAAVDNLSLEVEEGDIYGFIGHNGAGKTTTIKAIVGIIDFDKGDIEIDGSSILTNSIECKRKISYIPDNPDLYEYLTGIQYLNFISDIYKVNKTERKERIEKYGEKFNIYGILGNLISSYSHGTKQKLAIMAALIHKPKLLILDEPFVGLDPEAVIILKDIMREICNDGGAIFFSTHVLDVAEKLCNKIGIIKNGKLLKNGLISEIKGDDTLERKYMEIIKNE
ncbi:MAG: ABC transporter ATP-binding protein [Clostridiales bacterium]|nr:ABC transporter ATP-binding protein [Clostridiales bacterium]